MQPLPTKTALSVAVSGGEPGDYEALNDAVSSGGLSKAAVRHCVKHLIERGEIQPALAVLTDQHILSEGERAHFIRSAREREDRERQIRESLAAGTTRFRRLRRIRGGLFPDLSVPRSVIVSDSGISTEGRAEIPWSAVSAIHCVTSTRFWEGADDVELEYQQRTLEIIHPAGTLRLDVTAFIPYFECANLLEAAIRSHAPVADSHGVGVDERAHWRRRLLAVEGALLLLLAVELVLYALWGRDWHLDRIFIFWGLLAFVCAAYPLHRMRRAPDGDRDEA